MFILLMSLISVAQIKVAVLDTGLDRKIAKDIPLCSEGHIWNFSDSWEPKHGTNVSGLIHKYNKNTEYCQIILQVFHKNEKNSINNALKHAIKLKVDVINMSFGGKQPDIEEKQLIVKALDLKIRVIVAAGNESMLINKTYCNYFPACYDKRIVVVGGSHPSSNYGNIVDFVEYSEDREAYGISLTGTSQATAIRTGKIIRNMGEVRVFKRRK